MYKLATEGKLKSFPGVSAPYEPPAKADLTLQTDHLDTPTCVTQILALLKARRFIA
jgi:adenylylsulfate kinase-like enzyme